MTARRGSRRALRRLRARRAWPDPEAGYGGRFVAGWTGECAGSCHSTEAGGGRLSGAAVGRERSELALDCRPPVAYPLQLSQHTLRPASPATRGTSIPTPPPAACGPLPDPPDSAPDRLQVGPAAPPRRSGPGSGCGRQAAGSRSREATALPAEMPTPTPPPAARCPAPGFGLPMPLVHSRQHRLSDPPVKCSWVAGGARAEVQTLRQRLRRVERRHDVVQHPDDVARDRLLLVGRHDHRFDPRSGRADLSLRTSD